MHRLRSTLIVSCTIALAPVAAAHAATWYGSNVQPADGFGIAQGGAATSITLAATASASDDVYNDYGITIAYGTGQYGHKRVTAYNGTSKVATVDSAWSVNPAAGSIYVITEGCDLNDGTAEAVGATGPVYSPHELMQNDVSAGDTVYYQQDQTVHPNADGTGTLQGAGRNYVLLEDQSGGSVDDEFNGWIIEITAGRGQGQLRTIWDYDASGASEGERACYVGPWDEIPDTASTYVIQRCSTLSARNTTANVIPDTDARLGTAGAYITLEGYAATPGDDGLAWFMHQSPGSTVAPFGDATSKSVYYEFRNIAAMSQGSTTGGQGFDFSSADHFKFTNCHAYGRNRYAGGFTGSGFAVNTTAEWYGCSARGFGLNYAETATAGFILVDDSGAGTMWGCVSRFNKEGVRFDGSGTIANSIFTHNWRAGIHIHEETLPAGYGIVYHCLVDGDLGYRPPDGWPAVETGAADGGAANYIDLESAANPIAEINGYATWAVMITSGARAGDAREIYYYDPANHRAYVFPGFGGAGPAASDTYALVPAMMGPYAGTSIAVGTVQASPAPDATHFTGVAGSGNTINFYVGWWVWIVSGTGEGQNRRIASYDKTTKVFTVTPAWTTTPAAGDHYVCGVAKGREGCSNNMAVVRMHDNVFLNLSIGVGDFSGTVTDNPLVDVNWNTFLNVDTVNGVPGMADTAYTLGAFNVLGDGVAEANASAMYRRMVGQWVSGGFLQGGGM